MGSTTGWGGSLRTRAPAYRETESTFVAGGTSPRTGIKRARLTIDGIYGPPMGCPGLVKAEAVEQFMSDNTEDLSLEPEEEGEREYRQEGPASPEAVEAAFS